MSGWPVAVLTVGSTGSAQVTQMYESPPEEQRWYKGQCVFESKQVSPKDGYIPRRWF